MPLPPGRRDNLGIDIIKVRCFHQLLPLPPGRRDNLGIGIIKVRCFH